jgi:hypothetical protein
MVSRYLEVTNNCMAPMIYSISGPMYSNGGKTKKNYKVQVLPGKYSVDLKQMTLKRSGEKATLSSKIIVKNLFTSSKTSLSLQFSTVGEEVPYSWMKAVI